MSGTCWICGAPADSAEHRFKKTDLTRAHGRGPYVGSSALSHVRAGRESLVQGPNSEILKYSQSLCKQCNNTGTQPFDRAYETFIRWVMENEDVVLHRRFIDFEEVYGVGWEESQCNLYKYFAKSLGCRLVDACTVVPPDIVKLLGQTTFSTGLRLTIACNEDILIMRENDRNGFIGNGDLRTFAPRSAPNSFASFIWSEHVSWLTTCYWYNCVPDGAYGSTWVADSKFIYIGSFAPLEEQSRK